VIELSHAESQIMYYAKSHFLKTDQLQDVRTILAHRSGIPPESFRDYDIVGVLMYVLEELQLQHQVIRTEFMSEIVFGMRYGMIDKDKSNIERFVSAVMGILCNVPVQRRKEDGTWEPLIKLEPIDPKYLPLYRDIHPLDFEVKDIPVWPDHCDHGIKTFIGAFEIKHNPGAEGWWDVHVYPNRMTPMYENGRLPAEFDVCLRHGEEPSEYQSVGNLRDLLLRKDDIQLQSQLPHYHKAIKIILASRWWRRRELVEHAVVRVIKNLPDKGVLNGQTGTIVSIHPNDNYVVEFADHPEIVVDLPIDLIRLCEPSEVLNIAERVALTEKKP
jgi:hypothetical protein